MKLSSTNEGYVRVSFVQASVGADGKMTMSKTKSLKVFDATLDAVVSVVQNAIEPKVAKK